MLGNNPGSSGQVTIWQEDFDQYADGTIFGANNNETNPDPDWISGTCTACIDTADWWEVRSGAMEARDVNQVVFLQTETIDISGFTGVRFFLDVAEYGDHEGLYFGLDACADQDREDYVNVLYRVDGGPWTLVSNALGWCGLYDSCGSHTLYGDDGINSGDCRDHDDDWGTTTVTANDLYGNWLEIRIETINSATDEIIRFDNMVVKGEKVLPVTLKSFSLEARQKSVLLQWETASEINNDYFEIERSHLTPNQDWETIARVTGAGTSTEINHYYFEDFDPGQGRSYYRLKQVDFDGKFEYSEIKSVMASPLTGPYPNPAKDYVIIPIDNGQRTPSINLYNIAAVGFRVEYSVKKNYIHLDLNTLSSGYYFITLNTDKYRILILK